jgi:hypothetical protein
MKKKSFLRVTTIALSALLIAGIGFMIGNRNIDDPSAMADRMDSIATAYNNTAKPPATAMAPTPTLDTFYRSKVHVRYFIWTATTPPTGNDTVHVTVKIPKGKKLILPQPSAGTAKASLRWVTETYEFLTTPEPNQTKDSVYNFEFLVPKLNVWKGVEFIEVIIHDPATATKRKTIVHHGTVDGKRFDFLFKK